MPKTQDVVNLILAAIPEIRAERARRREHGTDRTEMPVENVRSTELRNQLLSFDDESLLRAEAVLYFGRDRDVSFGDKLAYLRSFKEAKEVIVSTLLEKVPVCARYFAQAMADLPREGLSLEAV
jgi:hypothetical protein